MNQNQWNAVDHYINDVLVKPDAALDSALETSAQAGMPAIAVAPNQGKLLHLLARLIGARKVLEVGTLGGYSTIWLARALPPGGKLITLESVAKHAEIARANVTRAGLANVVEHRLGLALDTLPQLAAEGAGPFDLVFIDADKANIPAYVEWSIKLARPGTLLIVDNVVRDGAVIDANSEDPSVQGVRRMHDMLSNDPRVSATAIQTVGTKGWDGFTLAMVVSPA